MSGLEDSFVLKSPPTILDADYSQARNILDLTSNKQKQLRRQRTQRLLPQLLLKRTHVHVCQLLDSHCSIEKPLPLATVDTNKRKSDDQQVPTNSKKPKLVMDKDILQFLRELNAVKIPPSDQPLLSSSYHQLQSMEIVLAVRTPSTVCTA